MSLLQQLKKHSTFSAPVFAPGFLFIGAITALCLLAPQWAQKMLGAVKDGAFHYFSWFYILVVSLFIVFMLLLALSSLGDIRLGADDEEAEFPFLSWVAMLFAAGMGVGLMYFGVAEPLMHAASSITQENVRQDAMLYTFYHWGVHPWAIYGTIALALAYFGYRYRLPLSLRSTFYPLLKDKINGVPGHIIDALALTATVFGIVTTLGYGAAQLNAGLQSLGLFSEISMSAQAVIIVCVVSVAIASAISGVGKGVRRLSEINLSLALLLLLFVLVSGPTVYLLSAFSENIGYYLSHLVEISFKTFAYDPEHTGWFSGWTILYWAWWFSWAPFVGLFIARISRGRTVREFIFGVLIVPSLFNLLWFTVFGNSAILTDAAHQGALGALTGAPEKLLFAFLEYFPLSSLTSIGALVILALFFITSADSGIYVLNNIASIGNTAKPPRWQSILWGVVLIVLSIALLNSGGLGAVQAMTLVVALPFAAIMLMMCYSLLKGLQTDSQYFGTKFNPGSVFWSGEHWKKRLRQMLTQPQAADMKSFLRNTVQPAFDALATELREVHGLTVTVQDGEVPGKSLELVIEKGMMRNFIYGVRIEEHAVAPELCEDEHLPNICHESTFEPMTYFGDGRQGYDVQYMSREELIADILKQYQRYLALLEQEEVRLMTHSPQVD